MLPYWEERIAPALRDGERVLISAHGNSLRALVKHLSGIPDDEITGLEIPTGQPIVYELDEELERDRALLSEGPLSPPPRAGPSEFLDALAVAVGAAEDVLDACRRAGSWRR